MKIALTIVCLLCLSGITTFAQRKLNIDLKSSVINWTGHAEIGSYAPAGTLNFSPGTVTLKGDNISEAMLSVDMKSMQQSNNDLLTHLKSADFFDVEKYPASMIRITRLANGNAYGQLTIKNKSLPFTCPVNVQKTGNRYTISGKTIIDRTRYGIIYNSGSFFSNLGDHAISNTFDIAFNVVADAL